MIQMYIKIRTGLQNFGENHFKEKSRYVQCYTITTFLDNLSNLYYNETKKHVSKLHYHFMKKREDIYSNTILNA